MRVKPGLGARGRLNAEDSWEKGMWTQPAHRPEGPVRQGLQLSQDLCSYFFLNPLDFISRLRIERIRNQAPISSPSLQGSTAFLPDPQGRILGRKHVEVLPTKRIPMFQSACFQTRVQRGYLETLRIQLCVHQIFSDLVDSDFSRGCDLGD